MKRFIYIFILLSIHYNTFSQCDANFIVVADNSDFSFTNLSTISENDTITSLIWRFGDGSTSITENPTHTYTGQGLFDVILQISTEEGCSSSDTMAVEVCTIELDFNLSSVCDQDGEVALSLEVNDLSNALDSVLIFLDDLPVTTGPVAILDGILNYNVKIPGDGNQHFISLASLPNGYCSQTIGFFVTDCNTNCFLSGLQIDDGFQETHEITLQDSEFVPNNKVINLGDRVRFTWFDDGHTSTSLDSISSDMWDSGIQDSSFVFEITPKKPGLKQFFSTTDGGAEGNYTGNIIANCPESRGSIIEISFLNTALPPDGFYIGIDGVILKDTKYAYSTTGITSLSFFLPGDDKTHQISVIDVEDESCSIKETVRAISCNGFFECSLNVNAEILERCDQDSMVLVGIDVTSLTPSANGVHILLDDTLVMDTIFFTNSQATTSIPIFGDGLIHTIKAIDLTDTFCRDEVAILVNDCAAQCSIDNLEIGTGSNSTVVLAVSDFAISVENLTISSGDDVLWQWIQDSLVGVRSVALSGSDSWDSGLLTDGDIYISPILTAGIHPYYLYNAEGDTLFSASLEVVASCDENKIPVFYNFFDTNGSIEGYDIYIDSIRLVSGPFQYALDGNNRGIFQLEGDDQQHLIEIRDLSEMACYNAALFVAPTCEIPPCGGLIELLTQDSCFNDNTINFLATVSHPEPTEQGFVFRINGELYEGFPFQYGDNGETTFANSILADSSVYTFTYVDLADPNCVDTLIYQSPLCVTDCNISLVSTQIVDSLYIIDNPNTPDSLIGCQDSFINVEVMFNEIYSDSDSFRILVDSILDETIYAYDTGDGLNTIFVSVKGDDDFHTIQLVDHLEPTCTFITEVYTPICFSPCNLLIENIVIDSCANEIGYYTLNLDTTTNKFDYQVFYDGDSLSFDSDSLLINFNSQGDGLEHYILVSDNEEPLCKDSIFFTASYCLECSLDITLIQTDSCEIGDSIGYQFVFNPAIDSIDVNVTVDDSSFTIQPYLTDYNYNIRLRGDSSDYQYVFTSGLDQFCNDTFDIQTIDCTPIICDPNFTFLVDGLTITFTDSSTTSEPIIDQSWSINDIVNIGNVTTFNFTVDSIGNYNICHTITTDSCSSMICEDIQIGDPCMEVIPFFTVEKLFGGYQFTNMSVGNIDEYLYQFGDETFSSSQDPFHTYPDTGSYEACLTVRQEEFSCIEEYCEIIDILSSNDNIESKQKLTLYPNPVNGNSKNINFIYSEPDVLSTESISLINIRGQRIESFNLTKSTNDTYSIDFDQDLPDGIYYIMIQNKDGNTSRGMFLVY